MKKILVYILFLMCIMVAQAQDVEIDGVYYYLYESELRASVAHDGNSWDEDGAGYEVEELVVPEMIVHEGVRYTVKSIGDYAFHRSRGLKRVVMSDSIEKIGMYAFAYCEQLEEIMLPKNVEMVGSYAFEGSLKLEAIDVAEGNEKYMSMDGILCDASGERVLYVPAGRDTVEICEGVKMIDRYAFAHCERLEYVVLPATLQTISYYAFAHCNGLRKLDIPDGVTNILANAFRESLILNSVTIGRGIEDLGNYLFMGCENMDTITIYNIEPPRAEDLGVDRDSCVLKVFKKSLSAYKEHKYWSEFANIITLNELNVSVNDDRWGTVVGGGVYDTGEEVMIEAKAAEGYEFESWSDGECENPRVIVLNKDMDLVANFVEETIVEADECERDRVEIYVRDATLCVENNDAEYRVYDLGGRVVYSGKAERLELKQGVYIIETEIIIKKIVI